MRKNNFKKIIILTFILLISIIFCSCYEEREIKSGYLSGEGGYINGDTAQTIKSKEKTVEFSSVTAIANEGYRFISWNDGSKEATRQDTLSKSAIFTAKFQKIVYVTVEYKASKGGTISGTTVQTFEGKINTTQVTAVATRVIALWAGMMA